MSRDILDQIDHALADRQVSGDAMRWTPEPIEEPWQSLGYTDAPNPAFDTTQVVVDSGYTFDPNEFRLAMRAAGHRAALALRRMGAHLAAVAHPLAVTKLPPRERRRHRARCGQCNPRANPRPLCIDGHAYHRRRQARQRRRR